ncbi:alkylation response protein AidB-like acyl-CoA dehydrogenase [Bradyrhizobium sp. USDA 4354]
MSRRTARAQLVGSALILQYFFESKTIFAISCAGFCHTMKRSEYAQQPSSASCATQVAARKPKELSFTDEEQAFRQAVRQFLHDHVPPEMPRKLIENRDLSRSEMVACVRIPNKKGWSVPDWPEEYGGTGWTPVQHYIFNEVIQMYPARGLPDFGTSLVGPVIYTIGNEAQKKYYLPRIANADDWWCQGVSELGAGSDLASLKTRVRRVDHYIVKGEKTWTTLAQYADWIFCLVRTNPDVKKQQGISFFLINMKTPGVSVRPIQLIDGGHEVNEVYFDRVRVPVENLVGEENKGWDYAKFLLGNERVNIVGVGASKQRIRRIKDLAAANSDWRWAADRSGCLQPEDRCS